MGNDVNSRIVPFDIFPKPIDWNVYFILRAFVFMDRTADTNMSDDLGRIYLL
jgi:hypothetical protein